MPLVRRVSQQQLNKQQVIAVLEDTQRLQLLQLDLSVLTAAESVLRTSVPAKVTFVSTYDRTTDNYISATSSSKSTDYHKQASNVLWRKSTVLVSSVSVKTHIGLMGHILAHNTF